MSATTVYRAGGRQRRSERTRERIVAAVRELLAEGSFHESTVEQVADRAGIARATLYQHFPSRLELVDAMCDTFAVNPALLAIRDAVTLPDPVEALDRTLGLTVGFWSSEDEVLGPIYGVAAIDPAARDLVERQRSDRRGEMARLVRNLRGSGVLRKDMREQRALALLMTLTSYETYRELVLSGLGPRQLEGTLRDSARELLLG